jgi:Rps23 Pro-64 3,4-dihydroxylase Tpa1-like proline 4-hydroxylase
MLQSFHTNQQNCIQIIKNKKIMLKTTLDFILKNKELFKFSLPFEHYVIDNLFNDELLRNFNNAEHLKSIKGSIATFFNDKEIKTGISHIDESGGDVYKVLSYLNSHEFVNFLSELTGINKLISDPEFIGGGIHLIPKGGKLNIHVDFSRAIFDETKFRRLNVLLYLNDGWQENWEGALELWDNRPSDGGNCIKKVYPLFNRIIIFGTGKNSWHGHPTPLNCPDGEYRKSLATYYYSSEPGEDLEIHSTIY